MSSVRILFTGAAELPLIVGGARPPSLEALQATRPGDQPGSGLEAGRAETLREAGRTFGAQGGLAARSFAINEMLRRHEALTGSASRTSTIGDIVIDHDALVVTVDGEPVELTPTEMRLLLVLAEHPGTVYSRDTLLVDVWDYPAGSDTRVARGATI